MYPLPVVVAGCSDRVLPQVRRELLNIGIKVEALLPSISSALAHRDELRKGQHLFVVQLEKEGHWEELRRLSRTFPGKPVLALLAEDSDVPTVLEALYAGASQIALLPLRPNDLRTSLNCLAFHYGRSLAAGQVFAISGATGGCGATTIATNLAFELAERHDQRVVLAELSLQIGMLVTHLDIKPAYNLEDLIAHAGELDVEVVERSLTSCGDKLSILPGPERPIPQTPDALARLAQILDCLRDLADIVVLDIPCTFEDAYFETLLDADQVILVVEQRIPSIRNAQLVLNTLETHSPHHQVRLVVNRYDPRQEGFTVAALHQTLSLADVIPFGNDPAGVSRALNQGSSLRRSAPNSPLLGGIEHLAHAVLKLPEPTPQPSTLPTMFGRVRHALGLA